MTKPLFTITPVPIPYPGRNLTLKEASDLVTRRLQAPIIEYATGKCWYSTADTLIVVNEVLNTKHNHDWLQKRAAHMRDVGVMSSTVDGWQFVRWSTTDGNVHSHVYWDWESITKS